MRNEICLAANEILLRKVKSVCDGWNLTAWDCCRGIQNVVKSFFANIKSHRLWNAPPKVLLFCLTFGCISLISDFNFFVMCRYSFFYLFASVSSGTYSRISPTVQFKNPHRSFIVTVVIGLLCFNRSIRLRLTPNSFINLYVETPFFLSVSNKGL